MIARGTVDLPPLSFGLSTEHTWIYKIAHSVPVDDTFPKLNTFHCFTVALELIFLLLDAHLEAY